MISTQEDLEHELEYFMEQLNRLTQASEKSNKQREKISPKFIKELEIFEVEGDDKVFVTFPIYGLRDNFLRKETWPIQSARFKRLLSNFLSKSNGAVAPINNIKNMILRLEAEAHGSIKPVFTRIAGYSGKVYFDLCNDDWQVIEIDADGWRVINNPPVKFRRTKGMLPLPIPMSGGSFELLGPLMNMTQSNFILTISCLVGAANPNGPYPILAFQGEQGSAKTTQAKLFRAVLDPSKAPVRSCPKDGRDLVVSAQNSHILSYDNISGIQPWLSDALCRISTGGGYATRQLYTDDGETIFEDMRPIMLNGIEHLVSRHDLIDRCITCHLNPIAQSSRKSEEEIWNEFKRIHPQVLGALCDAVSTAIARKDKITYSELPRMADFAIWVQAAEPALPWESGQFIALYNDNREGAIGQAIDHDPVASTILNLMCDQDEWVGTATELLGVLNTTASDEIKKSGAWPDNAIALGLKFNRISAFLRAAGIEIERADKTRNNRFIKIKNNNNNNNNNNFE